MKGLFSSVLLFLSASSIANVCVDDARMFTIKSVIEQLDAGQNIPPLKLTPATFLTLTPIIRDVLGDNITVYDDKCVPVQIYKQTLPKPVEVPFEDLLHALRSSVIQDNQTASLAILANFKAAPKNIDDLLDMVTPLSWHTRHLEKLYSWDVFDKLVTTNTDSSSQLSCNKNASIPSLIDLYAQLDGRVIGFNKMGIIYGNSSISLYTTLSGRETPRFRAESGTVCSLINIYRNYESLKQIGVSLIEVPSGFSRGNTFVKGVFDKEQQSESGPQI